VPSPDTSGSDEALVAAAGAYRLVRRADVRIGRQIAAAVGAARSVLNVGAGTGSYEDDVPVLAALERSAAMIERRPPGSAPAVRGRAEALPFTGGCVDVALAILTVHQWADLEAGLAETLRVARQRVIVLTWDPAFARSLWLVEYLPEPIVAWDVARFVPVERLLGLLPRARAEAVPIPHDCTDGFLGAYWRRPEAYLSRSVRLGISSLAAHEDALAGVWAKLAADLGSGAWHARHGDLLEREAIDLGYRLIVSHC